MNAFAQKKPEPIRSSTLWLELTKVPRPRRTIPFPRVNQETGEPITAQLIMQPLTQEEQMAANVEADKWTKSILKDPQKKDEANLGYQHTYTNEIAIQVLFRACRDVDDPAHPAFPSPALLRRELTTDEIGVLFSNYCTVQSELGPIRADMSEEEIEALIVRLVEGASAFPFDSLSSDLQRALVLILASRLVSSWTATYLRSEQPSVGSETLSWLKAKLAKPEAADAESQDEASSGESQTNEE